MAFQYRPCLSRCGIASRLMTWCTKYRKDVGLYEVYWGPTDNSTDSDSCRIWHTNGPIVYVGDDLPYDIDEAGLKMVLVFS